MDMLNRNQPEQLLWWTDPEPFRNQSEPPKILQINVHILSDQFKFFFKNKKMDCSRVKPIHL